MGCHTRPCHAVPCHDMQQHSNGSHARPGAAQCRCKVGFGVRLSWTAGSQPPHDMGCKPQPCHAVPCRDMPCYSNGSHAKPSPAHCPRRPKSDVVCHALARPVPNHHTTWDATLSHAMLFHVVTCDGIPTDYMLGQAQHTAPGVQSRK